jgi:Chromo (CHRromatin Organisation MOdifier) domain
MSRLHPVFNVVKLTLAPPDPIIGRHPKPPPLPELVDGEEEWVVEEILDSKMINWKLWYLVKWEGFGIEHNSWEPWDDVHAPDLVAEFYWKHPGAARQITTIPFCVVPGRHSLEGEVDVRGQSISELPFRHSVPSGPFPSLSIKPTYIIPQRH